MREFIGNFITEAESGKYTYAIHGCNCFNTFGKGLAKQVARAFPQARDADRNTIKGDRNKMGRVALVDCGKVTIVNAYTQYDYWSDGPRVDYDAVQSCFEAMKNWLDLEEGRSILIPKIGAGLAGGDWNKIRSDIRDILGDRNFSIVYLPGEEPHGIS